MICQQNVLVPSMYFNCAHHMFQNFAFTYIKTRYVGVNIQYVEHIFCENSKLFS